MKVIAYDCYNHRFIEEGLINTVVPQFSRNDLKSNGTKIFYIGDNMADLRIRKPTPRECFRLMGVKDEDFDKVAKSQSDSSLYHLAGDSLITTIMMALFSQMLDINWVDKFNSKEWWNSE